LHANRKETTAERNKNGRPNTDNSVTRAGRAHAPRGGEQVRQTGPQKHIRRGRLSFRDTTRYRGGRRQIFFYRFRAVDGGEHYDNIM